MGSAAEPGPDGCPRPRLIQPPRRPGGRRRAPFLKACNRDDCPRCGPLRRGDFLRVVGEALKLADVSVLCTITAPGDDVLPRGDDGRCHRGPLEAWNSTEHDRWHLLHEATQRLVWENLGHRARTVTWVRELQQRGALHRHLVMDLGTPKLRQAARLYLYLLRRLGPEYGFGYLDVGGRPWNPLRDGVPVLQARDLARRAGYLAKYMAKGRAELVQEGAQGMRAYVHRDRTMATNVTRGSLQRRRLLWKLGERAGGAIPEAILLAAIRQNYGPVAGYPRDAGLPPPAPPPCGSG